MAASLRQDSRIARFDTPLGQDVLALVSFDGVEGMSQISEYRIEAISRKETLDFDAAIGRNCTVTVKAVGGKEKRYFDGIMVEAESVGQTGEEEYSYRLVLRSWLWLLSFRKNLRIFHKKTAPQIIAEIFSEHSIARFSDGKLSKGYPELEYCVQYRESDMDFVCRLMEKHGIAYWFEHSEGEHKLILADDVSSYKEVGGGARKFVANPRQHRDTEHFSDFSAERRFTTAKVILNDYWFENPKGELKAEEPGDAQFETGLADDYDYPGKYTQQGVGQEYAKSKIQMERSFDHHFHAVGDCVTCFPGALVTLEGHPNDKLNTEYIALRAIHSFRGQSYRSTSSPDGQETYEGRYEFVESGKPYAPPVVTPKPYVHGPQTAEVVGEGEIDVDKYGRILVRFHWDLKDDQSCRVRLAQVWAGEKWGGIFIPRIGHEVLVQFLEGDPDQPIVVGSVYNADNMPPYGLPGEKNIAGWKSKSTPNGQDGFNEFIFDDTKGSELVRFQAEKDLKSLVKNDETREVKHDRKTEIGNNEELKVGVERKTKIGTKDTLNVGTELKITAGTKVEIICGASKITMTPVKITIQSLSIEVKAMSYKTQAVMSEHQAAAIMDIKGALVKINS